MSAIGRFLAPFVAILVVVAVGVLAALAPLGGDCLLVLALFTLPPLYLAGLSWSARLNAGSPVGGAFDRAKFDSTQAAEAQLVAVMKTISDEEPAPAGLAESMSADLEQLAASESPATRAAIAKVFVDRLKLKADKPEQYYDRIASILETLQSRIGNEYDDTHTRTGWLMTAQAVLLGGFVAVLNAENINANVATGLRNSIPALGALVALVLSFAIFHGHALINRLKKTRSQVEEITSDTYGIPPTGVSTSSPVHHYGHFATKALPSVAFVGWSVLLGVVLLQPQRFDLQPDVGAQLIAVSASPAFAWSESTFHTARQPCPTSDAHPSPENWATEVITAWTQRPTKSPRDGLWLVGSTDRTALSKEGVNRYESNVGLGRARVETVLHLLIEEGKRLNLQGYDALTRDRFFTQVTGPARTPLPPSPAGDPGCTDPALVADRSVGVWIAIR